MIKKHLYGNFIIILVWYLLSFSIGTRLVPFPHQVLHEIVFHFNKLIPHIVATSLRLFFGFSISLIFGVVIGVSMGLYKKVDDILSPIVYCLSPIPKSVLTPVFLIIFGMNDIGRIMIVVFIVIFPIIVSVKDAITLIPKEYFIIAKTLNLSRQELYTKIIFKAILPNLLSTIKITIAIAVAVLYISENIGANIGLGYYIASNNGINNVEMYSAIVMLSLIGYAVVLTMDWLLINKCKWIK